MKTIFSEVLSVDGFGDIYVEISQWIKFSESQAESDLAIIGISFKGDAVNTESNFKSVQGINIENYSKFAPRNYAIEFIKSETHTKPLPSTVPLQTLNTAHTEFNNGQLSLSF